MHAKSGLRVVLKWMITGSGSVIAAVMWPKEIMQPATHPTRTQPVWTIRDLLLFTAVAAIALAVSTFGSENGIGVTSQPEKFPELLPVAQIGTVVSAVFIAAWVFLAVSVFNRHRQNRALSMEPGHFLALIVAASAGAGLLHQLIYATGHYIFSHPSTLGNGQTTVVDPHWLGATTMVLTIACALAKVFAWIFVLSRFRIDRIWRIAISCFALLAAFQIAMTAFAYAHLSGSAIGGAKFSSLALGYITQGLFAFQVVTPLSVISAVVVDKFLKRTRGRHHKLAILLYMAQFAVSTIFAVTAVLIMR